MATKQPRKGRLTQFMMAYQFNEEEKLQLGQDLVEALENVTVKEAEAKRVAKQHKDEIEAAKGAVLLLRGKVKTGQESRPVSARMIVNFADGVREYYAVDGDDLLGTSEMLPGDEQLTINDLDD